jgi:hypothetical protein
MKVRCVSDFYNEQSRERLQAEGLRLHGSWHFKRSLTVGKEYLVVALSFTFAPAPDELGPSVVLIPDAGYLVAFPLALFEVTDPRASRYWTLHVDVDRDAGSTVVTLGPPSIYHHLRAYLDQLEQGEPSVDADFSHVYALLEAEAASPTS